MNSIFRKTALDQISSPDQLDQVIVITPPRFWIAMIGTGLILAVAVLWSVFGRIPVNVNASGICMSDGGVHVLYSYDDGRIDEVPVMDGEKVQQGDVIARMTSSSPSGQTESIEFRADMSGTVMGLDVAPGNVIGVGSTVCRILDDSTDHMSAILYVPVSDGRKISPGMEVKIYPTTVNSQEYGHIKAVVSRVDNYVTSTGEMHNMLGDSSLVQSFSSEGPVIEIQCSLNPDSSTESGYEWSNRRGAQVELAPGTTVSADIMIEKKAPITMLFPMIDEKLSGNT